MKTKKLTPANLAPVKRGNAATTSQTGTAIAPSILQDIIPGYPFPIPFAGDDAE
ncbi:anacyclamide/piricyclamide family prenylated cyclic peptide [Oxynema aestuarii]|uniref:Anacyclamide/piricyclamide family prenylated cyclic peptide n=1 Tax=Oxynema aestuarii AP17 TaxID=2064643 RepID=A0A6H1U026_9CYAN|nr:anacyclamide/piricyclamide family prenylated cyclic peptide [Oxynema aestuarii]QIZ71373.1 anacyclamide/piricyclamide family prenylated cyclic peptide [Oxynema aestuarii AP17]RMH73399.1 MAG: anacyclamide/piricyclamide family prenylated cyclic peptide [Cyanobacteria bacterium J007]